MHCLLVSLIIASVALGEKTPKKKKNSDAFSLDVSVRDALAEKVEKAFDHGLGALENILFVPGEGGGVRNVFSGDCEGIEEKFEDKEKRRVVIEACFREYASSLATYCEIAPEIKTKEVKQVLSSWAKGDFSTSEIYAQPAGPGAAFLTTMGTPTLANTVRVLKALIMCTRRVPFKGIQDMMEKFGRVFMLFNDETKNPDAFDDALEIEHGGLVWEALVEYNKVPWTNGMAEQAIKVVSKYVGSAKRQTEMAKQGKWSQAAARTTAMVNSASSSKKSLNTFLKLLDALRENKKKDHLEDLNKCAALVGLVPNLQVLVDRKKNHQEGFQYALEYVESIVSEHQRETGVFTSKKPKGKNDFRTQAMVDVGYTHQCMVALHYAQKLLASVKTTGDTKKEKKEEVEL